MHDDLPRWLAERLRHPLPGRPAQARFEPDLGYGRHFAPPSDAREAAVVMLLFQRNTEWRLPLVLRPENLSAHGGQIGLPGGVIEPGEACEQAALRELNEELGIEPARVEVLGRLSPLYVFVSNFLVTPWLAWHCDEPQFRPSAAEVEEVLEVPVEHLLDATQVGRYRREFRGLTFTAPSLSYGEHCIWGATAMMLGELIALFEETAV